MIATLETTTYKLTAIYDLREWDEDHRCYIPIDDDEKNICQHCGRKHAKVYEVTRQDGNVFTVGATCSKKLFGWQPEKEEIKRLQKEADKLAKNRAHQKRLAIATPIAEEVMSLLLPEMALVQSRELPYGRKEEIYGTVDGMARVTCREGFDWERKSCLANAWRNRQIESRLIVLYPSSSDDMKRYNIFKLIQNACCEIFVNKGGK